MTGPFPKPTLVKVAEGNPGKQKLPKKEPKPKATAGFQPPAYLAPAAKLLWSKVFPEFAGMGLLTTVDAPKFAMYVDSIAEAEQLSTEIAAEGTTITSFNKKGDPYVLANPKCALRHQAVQRAVKIGAEFGDSPGSRARLGRLLDDDKDDLDEFLSDKPE
jgi:P27 family predicted phage terminase small subunit